MGKENPIQWRDPTADKALYRLDRVRPKSPVPLHHKVDLKIHGLKEALHQGKINHVQYKDEVTEHRRLLKRLKRKAR